MDDLIRRDAVLDTVVNMRLRCDTNDIDDFCALLLECFAVLPTAEQRAVTMKLEIDKDWVKKKMEEAELTFIAEQRKGKWLSVFVDGLGFNGLMFECSECGKRSAGRTNYCPNCGARMEESEC